jgi:hypothetical protein
MLEAIRPSTGGYVRAAADNTNLYLFARGDRGQTINIVKTYTSGAEALDGLEELYGLCVHYGLQVFSYSKTSVVVVQESDS